MDTRVIKKAAAASTLSFFLMGSQYVKDVRVLAGLALVALVVPPPFGFATAATMAVAYGSGKYLTRHAMHAFRAYKGYAQPGDFDVLDQYNRLTDHAYRLSVPLPVHMTKSFQKTVFRPAEIR